MTRFPLENGGYPSPWVQHGWNVFLNNDGEIQRAIDYDNGNPARQGLAPQHWDFVRR